MAPGRVTTSANELHGAAVNTRDFVVCSSPSRTSCILFSGLYAHPMIRVLTRRRPIFFLCTFPQVRIQRHQTLNDEAITDAQRRSMPNTVGLCQRASFTR